MKALLQPLSEIAGFPELKRRLGKSPGITEISGCVESERAQFAAGLADGKDRVLLIAKDDQTAKQLYEDYRLYDSDVLFYPARDMIFYQAEISGNMLTRQRMRVIKALCERKKVTVVTPVGGCMDCLLPFRVLQNNVIRIDAGGVLDLAGFTKKMAKMGYERLPEVDAPGQYAIRGGIVDIFSLTEDLPWRVELWDDEVDSIRVFDPETQRSVDELSPDFIQVYPATEEIGVEEDGFYGRLTDTFPDYFDKNVPVFLDEPARILENAEQIFQEYTSSMEHRLEAGKITKEKTSRMISSEMLLYHLNLRSCAAFTLLPGNIRGITYEDHIAVETRAVEPYNNQFPLLVRDIRKWRGSGYRIILLSPSHTRARRLADELNREEVPAFYSEDENRILAPGETMVVYGNASRGFEYPVQKFVLITESDIFGQNRKKKKKTVRRNGDHIRDFSEISPGDYVIHESHGMAIYRGIERVAVDGTEKDFIRLEYQGGSSLFVPATQLDLLQKYSGSDSRKPKLNKLGGTEWKKTKTRVRSAVQNIANDLVKLYAARQNQPGYHYGPDTLWQKEFEEMFPYEETSDQLQAIEDTKKDMESDRIMDRLICGDVGYGKTEVAIRAAFKAVQENKQVAMLAPTTILAQQHYNTFIQRFKDFPVRVELLSRFRTAAQQRKTIEDLEKGLVDIVIGTHRLLSKDVKFKDLGLLIVDEEQRFGVTHKEKIKKMKSTVDVISLTATPIPRTLHMGLVGIRDMSVLEEAPLNRVPVQTYVSEYDEEMVREAIQRELSRNGQVYYIYNRVNDIADVAGRVAKLVPDARIAFAHGRMKENELERIMYDFVNGDIDVLVSTTIVETGLDIPNANTLIVQDSEQMGLAQLYQLRGRVGRSSRTAYAFLFYRRNRILKEVAEKRLHALREFSESGSGVKIAMRDLEIRGAGNLLGAEQSGHMEAVGYDLYCKMLSQAVREAKGQEEEADFETQVSLSMDAFIPDRYIADEGQKLDAYKRISAIRTDEDEMNMTDELIDRYGEPPKPVQNLLKIALIRSLAHQDDITEIKEMRLQIRFYLYEKARLDVARIPELLEHFNGRMQFKTVDGRPCFVYLKKETSPGADRMFHTIRTLLGEVSKIRMP